MGKFRDLFSDRIWSIDTAKCSRGYAGLVRNIKLIRITLDTFTRNRMGFQCVALSYFVTLAIIPFLAIVFTVTGGLGLSDKITGLLEQLLPAYPQLVYTLTLKANGLIESARGGGVGLLSTLLFFWAIIWMMFQVERVFNNVWSIHKIPRKLYKRFGFYLLVLLLSPFLVVIFGTGIVYSTNMTSLLGLDLSDLRFLPKLLGHTVFYAVTVLTLSAMYTFIPATRVQYRNSFKAALISGIVFVIFQYLYLKTQFFVARFNRAYGVIAAVPLFLIWLNFSWQIIIYGAQLTYGYQNIDNYYVPGRDSDDEQ